MRFRNREHAARLLAERLGAYKGQNPLVLGVPRGAVPMAKSLPRRLVEKWTWCWCGNCGRHSSPNLPSAQSMNRA